MSVVNTTATYSTSFTEINLDNAIREAKIPIKVFIPVLLLMLLECVAIVVLNALVIAVFLKKKDLFHECRSLIMSLAVVDMLVGAVSGPLMIPWNRTYPRESEILKNRWTFYLPVALTAAFLQLSILHLGALSLERLHATFCPIKHRNLKKRVYNIVICMLWVTDFLGNVIVILNLDKTTENQELTRAEVRKRYYVFPSFFCLSCLVVVGISYFLIFIKIRFGKRPVDQRGGDRNRLTVTIVLVTFFSFLTWLPLLVFFLANTAVSSKEPNFLVNNTLRFLAGLNSLVNPLLYIFRVEDFKAGVRQLFQQILKRKATSYPQVRLVRLKTFTEV